MPGLLLFSLRVAIWVVRIAERRGVMSPEPLNPMAAAVQWVGRIVAVGLEMVLPGLAGQWLDGRFGTSFCALLGFAFGVVAGVWHLVVMTRPPSGPSSAGQDHLPS